MVVFHAGTKKNGDDIMTSGGRVLAITAYAPKLPDAVRAAYASANTISFEGKTYRRDIAHRYVHSLLLYVLAEKVIRALSASSDAQTLGLTYAQSGVSVDTGNKLVEIIKPYVRSTRRPGADAEIGGFGGIFDLKATGYTDPVLVSGTDGVGTKLRVAMDVGVHHLVGQLTGNAM